MPESGDGVLDDSVRLLGLSSRTILCPPQRNRLVIRGSDRFPLI
jgi:hypothetical protein